MKIPSARDKILKHVRELDRLWKSLKSFLQLLGCDFHIALEWPHKCRYWKLRKVNLILNEHKMTCYHFDGCALGMKNDEGGPLQKPWTMARLTMKVLGSCCQNINAVAINLMHDKEEEWH